MENFNLQKIDNKYFFTNDNNFFTSVEDLAINFNIENKEIIKTLSSNFNCHFKKNAKMGNHILYPYFKEKENGLKAIEWLNSLLIINEMIGYEANGPFINVDFNITKSYLNEIHYYIQTKFGR